MIRTIWVGRSKKKEVATVSVYGLSAVEDTTNEDRMFLARERACGDAGDDDVDDDADDYGDDAEKMLTDAQDILDMDARNVHRDDHCRMHANLCATDTKNTAG